MASMWSSSNFQKTAKASQCSTWSESLEGNQKKLFFESVMEQTISIGNLGCWKLKDHWICNKEYLGTKVYPATKDGMHAVGNITLETGLSMGNGVHLTPSKQVYVLVWFKFFLPYAYYYYWNQNN